MRAVLCRRVVLGLLTSAEGMLLDEIFSDSVNTLYNSISSGSEMLQLAMLAGYSTARVSELTAWLGQSMHDMQPSIYRCKDVAKLM